jgi:DNA polymerase III, delta subunit
MSLGACLDLAREERLYPSLILHGGTEAGRQEAALKLARTLLCEKPPAQRPCGACRHCRRAAWPEAKSDLFHPDFFVLEQDLKTATSVDAVKNLLRSAQLSPFEARGQVFVIAAAATLTGEAANALLKALEEPAESAPRHFLLLAPSQFDLLPTLRSRSLSLFLGPGEAVSEEAVEELAGEIAGVVAAYAENGAGIYLLALAGVLAKAGDWKEVRSGRPWTAAAQAILRSLQRPEMPPAARRRMLALAQALLQGMDYRLRGIPPERILEGLVSRHLVVERG